jgi:tetratricopeptide (TPR) repeat protein
MFLPVIDRRPRIILSMLAIGAVLCLIVGCTSVGQPPSTTNSSSSMEAAERGTPGTALVIDALPEINLTGPLLYQIMAAEVALQRGDAGSAFATYLSVARQTRDPRLARRAVEIAFGARAPAQALEAAQLWRELAPHSTEATQTLAAIQIANGRYQDAAPLLTEQIRKAANPIEELARVQRTLARGPDRAGAFQLLETLAKPYGDDLMRGAEVHLILANGAHAAGQSQRAVQEARAAVTSQPDSERATLMAAQFLARPDGNDSVEGRSQALAMLQAFLQRRPDATEVRLTYARLLIADNKLPGAREQFADVLKRDAANVDALYAMGVLTLDGKPPRTESRGYFERYLKVVETAPGNRDPDPAYLNLARIAEEERKFDEALKWLERIDDGEQYVPARLRQALVLGKMKRVDEGRKLLAEFAAQPGRSEEEKTQAVMTEGQMLREARRYRDSFDVLATALAKSPDNTNLLYDTAMAAERLDRIEVMETHLRRMMQLKPDDAHAFNALGYTFADRNVRLQEARELVAQALKLSPSDGYIMDSMGWVHYRLGDLPLARDYLERAWKSRPEAEVGAHLGEVLWQMGDRDSARRIWREAAATDPENESLRTTLARLKVRL